MEIDHIFMRSLGSVVDYASLMEAKRIMSNPPEAKEAFQKILKEAPPGTPAHVILERATEALKGIMSKKSD